MIYQESVGPNEFIYSGFLGDYDQDQKLDMVMYVGANVRDQWIQFYSHPFDKKPLSRNSFYPFDIIWRQNKVPLSGIVAGDFDYRHGIDIALIDINGKVLFYNYQMSSEKSVRDYQLEGPLEYGMRKGFFEPGLPITTKFLKVDYNKDSFEDIICINHLNQNQLLEVQVLRNQSWVRGGIIGTSNEVNRPNHSIDDKTESLSFNIVPPYIMDQKSVQDVFLLQGHSENYLTLVTYENYLKYRILEKENGDIDIDFYESGLEFKNERLVLVRPLKSQQDNYKKYNLLAIYHQDGLQNIRLIVDRDDQEYFTPIIMEGLESVAGEDAIIFDVYVPDDFSGQFAIWVSTQKQGSGYLVFMESRFNVAENMIYSQVDSYKKFDLRPSFASYFSDESGRERTEIFLANTVDPSHDPNGFTEGGLALFVEE